ncbi:MAG: helix-turn-helix domain-containing protein [Puniceicoccaceae bacterium]
MLEDLKLDPAYDGFLFLAEARHNPPILRSHRHVELELNLVTQGSVTYIISGRRYTFPRGSMLWIFPAQEHQLVDRTPDAGYYVAVFKPELIERVCHGDFYAGLKQDSIEGEAVLTKIMQPEKYDLVIRTMDSLMEGSLDSELLNREAGFGYQSDFRYEHGDPDALNAGLHYLLVHCWKVFQREGTGAGFIQLHPSVSKVLTLINEENNEMGLTQLAGKCGISGTYLSRLFKEQIGVPLNHYRNSVRLRAFMEHYRTPPRKTILECVYSAGFGSYAQFYKVFIQSFGLGPREYLKD